MKDTTVTLGHGSGWRQSAELVSQVLDSFRKRNIGPELEDAALLPGGYAMTVDGFTVSPRRFPGGDIGHLCVCGCANDLAVRGASPDFLGISLVLEEGLSSEEATSYMESAASTCARLGMTLAAGDTKVVPSGAVDGMIITGCAFGRIRTARTLSMTGIHEGDTLLVTTSIGRHGAAIASARFDLPVEGLLSDCAPLWPALSPLLHLEGLRCMRDCTRGGLGTVLCEWAEATGLHFSLDEDAIPVGFPVQSLCDVLGFDLSTWPARGAPPCGGPFRCRRGPADPQAVPSLRGRRRHRPRLLRRAEGDGLHEDLHRGRTAGGYALGRDSSEDLLKG